MKQWEAVVKTMENLWWMATLWELNYHVFKIKDCERKTKTPFASIRRIVQECPEIYRIKPWLYWLVNYKKKNEALWIFEFNEKWNNNEEFSHSYYQWLIVEIWNFKKYQTYIPQQDQNKSFLNKKLWDLSNVHKIYEFWYENFIKRAKTVDVIRFNNRNMPNHFYEVEHSTDIQNSLLKFVELQDFNAKFTIVADFKRKKEYEKKLSQVAFDSIKKRVDFLDYETLAQYHSKAYEYFAISNNINM